MVVRLNKDRNHWFVDIPYGHGRRFRKYSPENSKRGAQAFELTIRSKLARGEDIDKVSEDSTPAPIFQTFATKWLNEYAVANNRPSECRNKEKILKSSLVPFLGKLAIDKITAQHVDQYKASMRSRGLSAKTINNRLGVLRTCLSTAYRWCGIPGTPPKIAQLKNPPPKTDRLTAEEFKLLLNNAKGVLRELILTGVYTSMRPGELRALQWESIDWSNRLINIRHSWCDFTRKLVPTKTDNVRYVKMRDELYELLHKRKKNKGFVFAQSNDEPLYDRYVNRQLKRLCAQVHMRKITGNTLRHSFASFMVEAGAPLPAVQALMGRTNIKTTMRYTHLSPNFLEGMVGLLPSVTDSKATLGQQMGNKSADRPRHELTIASI